MTTAVAAFRDGVESGRLHHAWLISGPEGVGKALFAHKAALRVLAEGQRPVGPSRPRRARTIIRPPISSPRAAIRT